MQRLSGEPWCQSAAPWPQWTARLHPALGGRSFRSKLVVTLVQVAADARQEQTMS